MSPHTRDALIAAGAAAATAALVGIYIARAEATGVLPGVTIQEENR